MLTAFPVPAKNDNGKLSLSANYAKIGQMVKLPDGRIVCVVRVVEGLAVANNEFDRKATGLLTAALELY